MSSDNDIKWETMNFPLESCRAILNSPLLRRRNKNRSRNSTDSSDDEVQNHQRIPRLLSGSPKRSSDEDGSAADEPASAAADGGKGNCYENLETFQKHQLKQKVRIKQAATFFD